MGWQELQEHQPELAAFGQRRFGSRVAYLATVDADGSPRVHPVTPIVTPQGLTVFMEPTSPKGHDPAVREQVADQAPFAPSDDDVLFELLARHGGSRSASS